MTHASTAVRPVDTELESERNAYNAAFYELGLRWHWDSATFAALQAYPNPCDRIRRYIEAQHPHLLRAYDAEFLVQAVETRKTAFQRILEDCGKESFQHFDWAEARAAELGV